MNFNIIEKCVIGKTNDPETCEDRIIITDDFICVVDGATSKSKLKFNGKSQGVVAGEIIEKCLQSIPKHVSLHELINYINEQYQAFYCSLNMEKHMKQSPVDRLSASVAIYSKHRKSLWLVGDCQALIDKKRYTNYKLIDMVLSDLRSFILESYIALGIKVESLLQNDKSRKKILEYLINQTLFQNNNFNSVYSYGVLDGFPIDSKHLKSFIITNPKKIVLASDGYPKLYSSLNKTEKYLKYIIKNDPLCYALYKSTKGLEINNNSYDDRAYISFELKK